MQEVISKREIEKINPKLVDIMFKEGDMSDFFYKRGYGINVQNQADKETAATYKTYGLNRAEATENKITEEFTKFVDKKEAEFEYKNPMM